MLTTRVTSPDNMAASLVRAGCQILRFVRPGLTTSTVESRRGVKQHMKKYLKELYQRRLRIGPEKLRHRSEFVNWNYDAEVYAFAKRLGEDFSPASLRTAFTHSSYIEKEEKRRADLGIDVATAPLGLTDNSELIQKGEVTASRYIKAYLRQLYPAMFEEAVVAIHDHLMSDDTLSFVASHIGIGDIMLCADFPPQQSTLSKTFLAVVSALENDQGVKRAESLVRDLVVAQLVGKDLSELWSAVNPMGLLMAALHAQGRSPPEPRLQWQAGQKTIMAVYQVGIYSDQRLIGEAPGETVTIAEEMAAHDAVNRMMGVVYGQTPLVLSSKAEDMELNYDKENPSAEELIRKYEGSQKQKSAQT